MRGSRSATPTPVQPRPVLAAGPTTLDGLIQPVLDEALADALDGRQADVQRPGDGLIGPGRPIGALVGLQQDPGAREFSGGRSACRNPMAERRPVALGQGDHVLLAHARACRLPLRS
jgi:hypothetical protein